MSTSFFIGPIDPAVWYAEKDKENKPSSDLKINPAEYQLELLRKWPYANIGRGVFTNYLLWWTLDTKDELGPEGGLQSDQQHVSFKYGKNTFIDFILWHRGFVSANYQLYLFNSSSVPKHLILTPKSTVQHIEYYLAQN
jgi:hypothetical protein